MLLVRIVNISLNCQENCYIIYKKQIIDFNQKSLSMKYHNYKGDNSYED